MSLPAAGSAQQTPWMRILGCGLLGGLAYLAPRRIEAPPWPTLILLLGSLWGGFLVVTTAPAGVDRRRLALRFLAGWGTAFLGTRCWHFAPLFGAMLTQWVGDKGAGATLESFCFQSEVVVPLALTVVLMGALARSPIWRTLLALLPTLSLLPLVWIAGVLAELVPASFMPELFFLGLLWAGFAFVPWLILPRDAAVTA